MNHNISDISGNFKAYQELTRLLERRQATAFVGSGASAALYGDWSALIQFLISEAIQAGLATEDDGDFWLRHASRRPQQVVRGIKHAFRENRIYNDVLKKYFGPRIHPRTGKTYTPLHEAIVKLPFKGIVTTNYDACLSAAFSAHRPDLPSPQHFTWQDNDYIHDWYTQDVFENDMCPLLHAHGIWNRPETLILDNDMYRQAYSDGIYLRMFRHLWTTQHLVLIGVGFSDSWLDRVLDDMLTYMAHGGGIRHVAILGLREEDERHVTQLRDLMQNAYNAFVLFYRMQQEMIDGKLVDDHSALLSLLHDLYAHLSEIEEPRPVELSQEAKSPPGFSFQSRDYSAVEYLQRIETVVAKSGQDPGTKEK